MVRVLISYRRDDSAPYAGRIYDSLCERLGRTVFLDIDSIEPGEDFPEKLRRTLENCHAVLAVIGPRWLSASDAQGRQRLRLEDDYVRLEVAEALRKGCVSFQFSLAARSCLKQRSFLKTFDRWFEGKL